MATRSVLTDLDFEDTSRILNLPDATTPQEPATFAQLNSALEKLDWKDDCRVASVANINLASPGTTIDGVAMNAGDRFLAKDSTLNKNNGIYVWNGAAVAATRADDADTAESLNTAVVNVQEGTANAETTWRQTQIVVTLGTDDVLWTTFGVSAPSASESTAGIAEIATQAETDAGVDDARIVTPLKLATYAGLLHKHSATFGDNSSTSFTITHNFGTKDVLVQVYRTGGSQDEIICEVDRNNVNSVDLLFDAAVATNALRAVIVG